MYYNNKRDFYKKKDSTDNYKWPDISLKNLLSDIITGENKKVLDEIIQNGNAKMLNEFCTKFGEFCAKNALSTSQIRNVLDTIQRMQKYDESRLELLRPKLAYVAGRNAKSAPIIKDYFQPLVDKAIQMVNKDNFENFRNFVEAIVAYHRYYGGKE